MVAGLEFNLWTDPEAGSLLSTGATFELPIGSHRAFQGGGEFHLFLSVGTHVGCWNWLSGSGFRLPTDTVDRSQMWYWSNHFSRKISDGIYFLADFNWYHWMRPGQGGVGVEGLEVYNLGSVGVAGNDIATGAFGFKYKPSDCTEIGVAWENPLTDRRDILDNRLTVALLDG